LTPDPYGKEVSRRAIEIAKARDIGPPVFKKRQTSSAATHQ
jgi:hypothetical protein